MLSPSARTATLAGLGVASRFLALDEALAVHETLGHNMGFLTRLPGIDNAAPAELIAGR